MAEPEPNLLRRADARERARRDLERRRRRAPKRQFWAAVALTGTVGWPIVLLALLGALLGRTLDQRWDTGVRFTVMLLFLATCFGTWLAFRTVRGKS